MYCSLWHWVAHDKYVGVWSGHKVDVIYNKLQHRVPYTMFFFGFGLRTTLIVSIKCWGGGGGLRTLVHLSLSPLCPFSPLSYPFLAEKLLKEYLSTLLSSSGHSTHPIFLNFQRLHIILQLLQHFYSEIFPFFLAGMTRNLPKNSN
jgi:hypothetical protein